MSRRIVLAIVLLGGVGLLVARGPVPPGRSRPLGEQDRGDLPARSRVEKVLDGDSVLLSDGVGLRYIGIDAPERGEPFAEEARDLNRRLVEGKEVRLEYDEETEDRYGRLLAYVWVEAGEAELFVNGELIRTGHARASPHFPNFRRRAGITRLQREAILAGRGLWESEPVGEGEPVVGSSQRFHRPSCEHASKIRRPRHFPSRRAALLKGLGPCRVCRP